MAGHAERIVGKPLATFVEGPDQRAFYAQLSRLRHAGSGGHLTINLTIHDDVSIPANLRATVGRPDANGDSDINWLVHDRRDELVTEAPRAGEERLRALFDTAQVGIILCDNAGEIVFINQYADRNPGRGATTPRWTDGWRSTCSDDLSSESRR